MTLRTLLNSDVVEIRISIASTRARYAMKKTLKMMGAGGEKRVELLVKDSGISWTSYKHGILCTREIQIELLLRPRIESSEDEYKLIVQYVKITEPDENKIQARLEEFNFIGSREDCEAIKTEIDDVIRRNEPMRPNRLLIFINPKSGFGTSVRDYHAVVAPLLAKCGLSADAIVTKHKDHADDVLDHYDLSSIGAVVSMGGDGSISQVTNGLLRRTMKDAKKDIDDPSIEPEKPSIPVALIPGGSWCVVTYYSCGAKMDIETAVLAIALGHKSPWDVVDTRHGGRWLGYANLVSGCGVFANVIALLESVKWLGRFRYWLLLPTTWWSWFNFEVEIDYLPAQEESRTFQLYPEADGPLSEDVKIREGPWPGWKTLRCRATEVWITILSVADFVHTLQDGHYRRSDQLSTGKAIIDVLKGKSFLETMKGYRTWHKRGRCYIPRKYVEQIEVTEMRVRGIQEWRDMFGRSCLHVDGEHHDLHEGAFFEAKIRAGALSVLSLSTDLVDQARTEG